jgi:hypothetical protein
LSPSPNRKDRRAWASLVRSAAPTREAIARVTHCDPDSAEQIQAQLREGRAERRAKRHTPLLRDLAEATEEVRKEHELPYCGGKRFTRALAYTDALQAQGEGDGAAALAAASDEDQPQR